MPAARASWVIRTTASSTSRGATIIRSASSSTTTRRYGYGASTRSLPGGTLHLAGPHRLVEVVDVPEAERREVVVAHVHLAHDPVQRLGGLLRVRDDRRDQVRHALVDVQLDPLGVDQDHPHLVGRRAHQDRGDHRVHERRLAGAGRTGDQQVRHLRHVRDDEAALDVLAEPDDHRVVVVAGVARAEHVAEGDDLLVGVRDLDADRGLAGDRGEDPDVGGGHGVGDVLAERGDLLDLDRGAELDLVAGDRRAAGVAGDLGVDVELLEHLGEPGDDRVGGLGARLVHRAGLEHLVGGQRVGDVAGQRELLDAGRQRGVRRRPRPSRRRAPRPARGPRRAPCALRRLSARSSSTGVS